MSRLRVWWIPQAGMEDTFYVPVQSVEEAKKVLDILAAYDMFQVQNFVKPDCSNVCGLEEYNDETGEWNDWFVETDDDYFDDVDDYCERCELCECADELADFSQALFSQLNL